MTMTFNVQNDVTYNLDGHKCSIDKVHLLIKSFKYIFIESHNVDLPKLIAEVLEQYGLLELDKKRKRQSQPLEKLQEFIELSQLAIADIEKEINSSFDQLTDFDGVLKDKKVKINFVEFEKLRDVVKTMTEITLFDGNSLNIASKGSGAQRALFLALMQYISQKSKRKVIWGVDEPEAFLQPKLQKQVAKVFLNVIRDQNQPIILTTHSQHFINLNNLENTHLFVGKQDAKSYTRKPGKTFYEMSASPIKTCSAFEKATLIKEHLGISGNDSWQVMPYNIIVEGEEDKKYLESLFRMFDLPVPNIAWAGGASKIGGYLQFYNSFASDLEYKPKVLCLFDNDEHGRDQASRIKPKSLVHLDIDVVFPTRHDGMIYDPSKPKPPNEWEIEDFIPPGVVLNAINIILRKNEYKSINKTQINNRMKPAHIDKSILKYAEECSHANNADKAPFVINNDGRKKQICMSVCEMLSRQEISQDRFNKIQIDFLKSISS